ncbi:hypothetical protein BGZ76_001730 [Entomortierella beljakovae]|nr:hypothetical protein BGZ76_001730 [Entomortierella beljakovae]
MSRSSPTTTRKPSTGIDSIRKSVMSEVAIPGKYQIYFKPNKRSNRKSEGITPKKSQLPKKMAAAKWRGVQDSMDGEPKESEETDQDNNNHDSKPQLKGKQGFENVAWRALEYIYARDVLPHPFFHKDYLEIVEEKIVEAVAQHAAAFKAMLARHARPSTSSRLTFQLVRQSDHRASMDDIWKRLESEIALEDESEQKKDP